MKDLKITRKKIDDIDEQLIKLFEERMTLVKDVIEYKIKNDMAIYDNNREKAIIEKNRKLLQNNEFINYLDDFTISLMRISKNMQEDILKANENE